VGSGELQWEFNVQAGTPLLVRVLDAGSGEELGRIPVGGWLTDRGPRDLGALGAEGGVRVSWRLASPFWQTLALPELDGPLSM
jgi:hypothetical protein